MRVQNTRADFSIFVLMHPRRNAFRAVLALSLFLTITGCDKKVENRWQVKVEVPAGRLQLTDISRDFFDPAVPMSQFQARYPWFQGSVPDEVFAARRQSAEEKKVYQEAIAKIDQAKLEKELKELFARVHHYFPNFKNPKVFLLSSSTQMYQEPVLYDPAQGFLFIDISSFMGEKTAVYNGIPNYFRVGMNPANMLPKVAEAIALSIVPFDRSAQKFIDAMMFEGKCMILQDAFLPDTPDYLKLGQTPAQLDWLHANETNIWNYFVENDVLYSPDNRMIERFIAPGPFSKFYTEVDRRSSPQAGVFIGWQIGKKYLETYPDATLQKFLAQTGTDIFTKSKYKPKD